DLLQQLVGADAPAGPLRERRRSGGRWAVGTGRVSAGEFARIGVFGHRVTSTEVARKAGGQTPTGRPVASRGIAGVGMDRTARPSMTQDMPVKISSIPRNMPMTQKLASGHSRQIIMPRASV